MIYKINESYFSYAYENNLNIIAESNIGCSFLIQADSCSINYLEIYDDSELNNLLSCEPYLDLPDEEDEYEEFE